MLILFGFQFLYKFKLIDYSNIFQQIQGLQFGYIKKMSNENKAAIVLLLQFESAYACLKMRIWVKMFGKIFKLLLCAMRISFFRFYIIMYTLCFLHQ